MDIRKIEYFISVAEHLNFSKAAEELHISHQALSKQIQVLEQELGAKLLERTTAKVSLTEVGRKLYDAFVPLMRNMYREYQQIQEFVKYKRDTLRIGYFNGLSYNRVISPMIQHILEKEPEIRIDMLATDIGLVKELLYQDSIDFAVSLMFDEKDWQGVSYIPFLNLH